MSRCELATLERARRWVSGVRAAQVLRLRGLPVDAAVDLWRQPRVLADKTSDPLHTGAGANATIVVPLPRPFRSQWVSRHSCHRRLQVRRLHPRRAAFRWRIRSNRDSNSLEVRARFVRFVSSLSSTNLANPRTPYNMPHESSPFSS